MGTREIIFLLYTFVLPAVAIVFDDAQWNRKKRLAAEKRARTPASRPSESSQMPPGVAHQL